MARPRDQVPGTHKHEYPLADPDQRNGPNRRRAQAFEAEYLRRVRQGRHSPRFRVTH